ncbi:MAG: hypothetical protein ABI321_12760 [Polyangia bacterium]
MRAVVVIAALLLIVAGFFLVRRPSPPTPLAEQATGSTSAVAPVRPRVRRSTDGGSHTALAHDTTPVALGWGSGPGQVGRRRDPESVSEGPMSFTHGKDGILYVLDQVNGRILRRSIDGTWLPPIKLQGITAQDLRVDATGGVAVLDRLGDKSLQRYDAAGNAQGSVPLMQLGLVDAAGATGLFDDDRGGLFVEESLQGQGKRVVHSIDGGPVLAGRPSRDGTQLVSAAIVSRTAGQLVVRALDVAGTTRWESPIVVTPSILSIILCDTDSDGNIYVGVLHARPTTGSTELSDEELDVWKLSSSGATEGHASLAHPASGLDTLHELSVGADGTVWWMHPAANDQGEVVEAIPL